MFANSVFITPGRFIERAFAEYFSRLLSNIQSELSRVPGSNKLSIENQTLQWLTRFYNALELFTTSTKEHTALTHSYQWRIQGRGPGNPAPSPPLIFRPNWGPKGRKKVFLRRPSTLFSGFGWPSPTLLPLSEDLHPPLVIFTVKTMLCSTWTTSFACGCCNSPRSGIANVILTANISRRHIKQ